MGIVELPTLDDLALLPVIYRATITTDELDAMGHMNIRYYVGHFDSAAWLMFNTFGLTVDYYERHQVGMFALEQHLRYVREVRVDEAISIRFRLVGLNAKRAYFMMLMANETQPALAATFESLGSFADLSVRRTAPFPSQIHATMAELYEQHQALPWAAPLCGSITV